MNNWNRIAEKPIRRPSTEKPSAIAPYKERFPGELAPEGETFEQGLERLSNWPKECQERLRLWKMAHELGWTAVNKGGKVTPQKWASGGDISFEKGDMSLWYVGAGWRLAFELDGYMTGHQTLGLTQGLRAEYCETARNYYTYLLKVKAELQAQYDAVDWPDQKDPIRRNDMKDPEWLRGCQIHREIVAVGELMRHYPGDEE